MIVEENTIQKITQRIKIDKVDNNQQEVKQMANKTKTSKNQKQPRSTWNWHKCNK